MRFKKQELGIRKGNLNLLGQNSHFVESWYSYHFYNGTINLQSIE